MNRSQLCPPQGWLLPVVMPALQSGLEKEMMVFTPDYGMQKLIAANLRFLQRCRARMAKLADRGLWYLFCHCRRYRAVRRYFHNADRTVTFQDLFSAAIAQFVLKGWGKASDFKCLLSAL